MTSRAPEQRRARRSPFGNRLLGSIDQSPRRLRVRIQLLLTVVLLATNLTGAALIFVIDRFAVPSPAPSRAMFVALAIGGPSYVLGAAAVGVAFGTAATLRALRWATQEGTTPNARERERAVQVPMRLTLMQLTLWLAGTALFTLLSVIIQPERALSTGLTAGLGSFVVAGIAYLLTEFALRPVSARALAGLEVTGRIRGVGVGPRMIIFWCLGTGVPVVGLIVAAIIALTTEDTSLTQLAAVTMAVGGVVLVVGLFITVLNARAVVAPIVSVHDALLAVEHGELDTDVVVYDGTELGQLQSGFNQMVAGLRERERIRDLFGRHVGHEVASAAASLEQVALGGQSRTASVLFVDLIGSTSYAAEHDAAEVVDVLNRFYAVVVDEVDREQGLVNKFIGDAVLAVFGAPVDHPDHAGAALAAARAMAARLAVEVPEIGAGIGIATGAVVAGNVGHELRFEYTVIGDAVNAASRLTELAKDVPGRVLAAWETVAAAGPDEADRWQQHGSTVLRGRSAETVVAIPR